DFAIREIIRRNREKQVEGRAKHGDRGSDARRALKSTFEVAIRGGIRTAESVFIRAACSSSLSQGFHHEGHEGARSQSRRKRRTRAFDFPPLGHRNEASSSFQPAAQLHEKRCE